MRRTQIYLDEAQDEELARRAGAEGLTKSKLIRRAIDAYLEQPDDEALRLARFRAAVEAAAGTASELPDGALYVDRVRASDVERQDGLERQRRG